MKITLIKTFAFLILKVVRDYPTHQTQTTDSMRLPINVRQNPQNSPATNPKNFFGFFDDFCS
ncbi:MAG: hypothetical protein AAFV71_21475 [Cyanobacteria bacterium J06633_8]